MKTWLCQGLRIWPKCDVTRKQRPMRSHISLTLQRNLHADIHRMQLLGYSPQPACSGWPAGFISTCFFIHLRFNSTFIWLFSPYRVYVPWRVLWRGINDTCIIILTGCRMWGVDLDFFDEYQKKCFFQLLYCINLIWKKMRYPSLQSTLFKFQTQSACLQQPWFVEILYIFC